MERLRKHFALPFIVLIVMAIVGIIPALAADTPYLRITQVVPTAYVNDSAGCQYKAVFLSDGILTAQGVSLDLTLPAGFAYQEGSLQAVFRTGSGDLTETPLTAEVSGTDPHITFTPALDLAPGQILEITYTLTTAADVAVGEMNVLKVKASYHDDENVSYNDDDATIVNVEPGVVNLTLTPVPDPLEAKRGETIILEARLTNDGEGTLFGADLTASWGAGFGSPELVLGGNATPVLDASGNRYEIDLDPIAAHDSRYFRFRLTVTGYREFALNASVTHPGEADKTYTASAVFNLLVNQPNIAIAVNPIEIEYGFSKLVEITVSNDNITGTHGPARQFSLETTFHQRFQVSGVSAGWTYSGGTFTYDENGGVIAAGASVPLSFTIVPISPNSFHEGNNGYILLTPHYTNDIEQDMSYPVVDLAHSMRNVPTLSYTCAINSEATDTDNARIFLGEHLALVFTARLTHVDKWRNGDITFTSNIAGNFTILGASEAPGTILTQNGNQFTWTMTPAQAAASPKLTLQVRATTDPYKAGSFIDSTSTIRGTTIWNSVLSYSSTLRFYLQSRSGGATYSYECKSVTNPTSEGSFDVCGRDGKNEIAYLNEYTFDVGNTGTWTGSTLTDEMDQSQEFVTGSAEYWDESTGNWNPVPSGSVIAGAKLVIGLDFMRDVFGTDAVAGFTVKVRYRLRLTGASLAPGTGTVYRFISRTDLKLANATDGALLEDGCHFYQGAYVSISRAAMGISAGLSESTISKGQVVQYAIQVRKLTPWNNNNLTVTLDTQGHYSFRSTRSVIGFGGQTPTEIVNPQYPDTVTYRFTEPLIANEGGTIVVDLVKTDDSDFSEGASLAFTDDLGASLSASCSSAPKIGLEGRFSVVVNPDPVKITAKTLSWQMVMTNIGTGTAYDPVLACTLKNFMSYRSSTVNGVPDSQNAVGAKNVIWTFAPMAPGESRTVTVTVETDGSAADYTGASSIQAYPTWKDRDDALHGFNAAALTAPSFVDQPTSAFVKNTADNAIELCGRGTIKLYIRNNGFTHNYNAILTQDFGQTGFIYIPGSAKIGGVPVHDPEVLGNRLIWTHDVSRPSGLSELDDMAPRDEFTLEFDVQTHEAFNVYQKITPSVTWQPPVEAGGVTRSGSYTGTEYRVPILQPVMVVLVDGRNVSADEASYQENVSALVGDTVEWRIRIQNKGSAAARGVVLSNILPGTVRFAKFAPPAPAAEITAPGPWNLDDIPAGTTVTYYVQGVFEGPCGPVEANTASIAWGPETHSLTAPEKSSDAANLVTQPVVDSMDVIIAGFTTEQGHVTLTFANSGPVMHDLHLTLNLTNRFSVDSAMTYGSFPAPDSGPGIGNFGVLTWHWSGEIQPGTHTISFDIRDANDSCADSSPLQPVMTYEYENSGHVSISNTVNGSTFTPAKPKLIVTQTPSVQIVAEAGDAVSWTIQVKNDGDADATHLTIVDIMGDGTTGNGFTFQSATAPTPPDVDETNQNRLTWSGLSLAAGQTMTFTVYATANAGGIHTNTVTATEYNREMEDVVHQGTNSAAAAMVGLIKTMVRDTGDPTDGTADSYGEVVTYTLRMDMRDTTEYRGMVIKDTLPAGLQYINEDAPAAPVAVTAHHSGKNLEWRLADFAGPGTFVITYRVRIINEGLASGAALANLAKVSFTAHYSNGIENIFPDSLSQLRSGQSFNLNAPSVYLSQRLSDPGNGSSVVRNQEIEHTLTITNRDQPNVSPAHEIRVEETIPAGERGTNPIAGVTVTKGGIALAAGVDYTCTFVAGTGKLTIDFKHTSPGVLQRGEVFVIGYKTVVDDGIGAGLNLTHSARVASYASQPSTVPGVRIYGAGSNSNVQFTTAVSTFSMVRTSPSNLVKPGDVVSYQARVVIPAGTNAYNISLVGVLPAGMAYVNGSSQARLDGAPFGGLPPVNVLGQTVTWATASNKVNLSNITGVNQLLTIDFSAAVLDNPAVIDGGTLASTFVYNYDRVDGSSRTNNTAVSVGVTDREPGLTITKSADSGGTCEAGSTVRYRITLTNTRQETAYDVTVNGQLDEKMDLSGTPAADCGPVTFTQNGRQLLWGEDGGLDIAPGSVVNIEFNTVINNGGEPKEPLSSTFGAAYSSQNGAVTNERNYNATAPAATDATLGDLTALMLALQGAPRYVIGATFTYRLQLTLTHGTTRNVVVHGTLPTQVEFVSASINPAGTGPLTYNLASQPVAGAQGDIAWDFDSVTVPSGEGNTITIDCTVRIRNDAANQDGQARTFAASASYTDGTGAALNTPNQSHNFTIREPNLIVTKSVISSGEYEAGSTVRYRIAVTNPSPETAYDAVVSGELDDKMDLSGVPTTGGGPVSFTQSGRQLTWGGDGNLDIAPGATVTIEFDAAIHTGAEPNEPLLSNISAVYSSLNGDDIHERNYSASAPAATDVTIQDRTALALSIQGTPRYTIGELLNYRLQLSMTHGTTRDVVVHSILPEYVEFVSASINPAGTGPLTYYPGSQPAAGAQGSIAWEFGSVVVPGGTANTITIDCTVRIRNDAANQDGQTRTFAASASYTDGTGAALNTPDQSHFFTIREPNLIAAKSVISSGVYEAGSTVRYRLTFTNPSPETAYDVVISGQLDDKLDLSGTPIADCGPVSFTQNGRQLTFWDDGNLDIAPGATVTIEFDTTIIAGAEPNEPLSSTFGADFSSLNGVNASERSYYRTAPSATDIALTDRTALTLSLQGTPRYVIGETMTYRLQLALTHGTSRNVAVRAALPSQVEFVSAAIAPDGTGPIAYSLGMHPSAGAQGSIVWEFGSVTVPGGEANTITIDCTVRIRNDGANQTGQARTFTALATYTDGTGAALTTPNQSHVFTIKEPALAISLEYPGGSHQAGDTLTCTLRIWHTSSVSPNDAAGYDVHVHHSLPAIMTYRAGSSTSVVVHSSDGLDWTLGTVDTSRNALNPVVISFDVVLTDDIQPNERITGAVALDWTSLPGTDPYERSGQDGSAGILNDYAAAYTAVMNAVDNMGLSLALDGADERAVGQTVTYRLTATLNEGTVNGMLVRNTLPSGMRLVSATIMNGNPAMTYTLASQPAAGDTGALVWNFGTVTNPANADTGDDAIEIAVTAIVLDVADNRRGVALSDSAQMEYLDGQAHLQSTPERSAVLTVVEPVGAIALTGPGAVAVAQPMTMSASATNGGDGTAWQSRIAVILPPEMKGTSPVIASVTVGSPARTLISPDDYEWTYDTDTGRLVIICKSSEARIDAGETLVITFQAALNAEVFSIRTIQVQAILEQYYSMDSSGGLKAETRVYSPDLKVTRDLTLQTPVIAIGAAVDKTVAEPGDTVHYEAVFTNNGNLPVIDGSFVIDLEPQFAGGTLSNVNGSSGTVSYDPSGGANGTGSITVTGCAIADGGGTLTVRWDVAFRSVLPNGTVVSGLGTLAVPGLPDALDVVLPNVTIASAPVPEVEKRDSDVNGESLMPGDVIRYSITIVNSGSENARDAVLSDPIPSNTTYVAGSTALNGTVIPDAADQAPMAGGLVVQGIAREAGVIQVGDTVTVEYSVRVNPDVTPGTVILNQATLAAHGEGAGDPLMVLSDDPDTAAPCDATVSVVGDTPMLYAVKTVVDENGDMVNPGDILTYHVTLTNAGNETATNIEYHDGAPENTTFVDGSLIIGGTPVPATLSSGRFTSALGDLAGRSTMVLTFQVTVNPGTEGMLISSQGEVVSDELPNILTDADGNPGNGCQPTVIPVGSLPVLSASMTVADKNGGSVLPGDILIYTVAVSNSGSAPADNLTVSVVLPADTDYLPATTRVNGALWPDRDGAAPILPPGMNLGTLAPGAATHIRYEVAVRDDVPSGTGIVSQADYAADGSLTGASNQTRVQVEGNPGTANVQGRIWWDQNYSGTYDASEPLESGWTVEILQKARVVDIATTDANGDYGFVGVLPGGDYSLRFKKPGSGLTWKVFSGLTLASGAVRREDMPLYPTGVVYDAVTRQPVSEAIITISGPAGFDADRHLLPGQQGQVTGADGIYRFDVLFGEGAPEGVYSIAVTPPDTYSPVFPSTILAPQSGSLNPLDIGGFSPVTAVPGAPASGDPTAYYLAFDLQSTDSAVVNNHIPLDPVLEGSVVLAKTAGKRTVSTGGYVWYTLELKSVIAARITPMTLRDVIPAGFNYVPGSASIDGTPMEPTAAGSALAWSGLSLTPHGKLTLTYCLSAGIRTKPGQVCTNTAVVVHGITGTEISNTAKASVRIAGTPAFTATAIVGKAFDDKNGNRIQDADEPGIQGVWIMTMTGRIIVTDAHGRYHIEISSVRNQTFGDWFVLKVDPRSVPKGAVFTTENPRAVRLTPGLMNNVDFGIRIPSGAADPEKQPPTPEPELSPSPQQTTSQQTESAAEPEPAPEHEGAPQQTPVPETESVEAPASETPTESKQTPVPETVPASDQAPSSEAVPGPEQEPSPEAAPESGSVPETVPALNPAPAPPPAPPPFGAAPHGGFNMGSILITIHRPDLPPDCELSLEDNAGLKIKGTIVERKKDEISGFVDITGLPGGAYDLVLHLPGDKTLREPGGFIVNDYSKFRAAQRLKPIYFDYNKFDLRSNQVQIMQEDLKYLKEHPELSIALCGYTDERGSYEYNLGLSMRRANTIRQYLIAHGIDASRITIYAFGKEQAKSGNDETVWQNDRRVDLLTYESN